MSELDRFEVRLTAAVRALADQANTSVDAAAVAERAIDHRAGPSLRWLARPLPIRVSLLVVLGLLVALLAWSVGVGAPWNRRASVGPLPAPSASLTTTDQASATPVPSTDGVGPEYVTGTEVASNPVIAGTDEWVDTVEQVRGMVIATVDTMNDPRVTGIGTMHFNGDQYGTQTNGAFEGSVAATWGTYRLQNNGGAWEGTWRGAVYNGGPTNVSGWLVGSGAYQGFTYYFHAWGATTINVEGVIYTGSPPTQ